LTTSASSPTSTATLPLSYSLQPPLFWPSYALLPSCKNCLAAGPGSTPTGSNTLLPHPLTAITIHSAPMLLLLPQGPSRLMGLKYGNSVASQHMKALSSPPPCPTRDPSTMS